MEVGEVLCHPNLGNDNSVRLILLQINSNILLHHLLLRRSIESMAAFADDDERSTLLPFPHRAALTGVLF